MNYLVLLLTITAILSSCAPSGGDSASKLVADSTPNLVSPTPSPIAVDKMIGTFTNTATTGQVSTLVFDGVTMTGSAYHNQGVVAGGHTVYVVYNCTVSMNLVNRIDTPNYTDSIVNFYQPTADQSRFTINTNSPTNTCNWPYNGYQFDFNMLSDDCFQAGGFGYDSWDGSGHGAVFCRVP